MSKFRSLLPVALCGALVSAACTGGHPIACNAACVADVKGETASYKPFAGARDEQWQAAFDTATAELAKGDWAKRLLEIQHEFCRVPGKPDSAKVNSLENDMLRQRALEAMHSHIDINDAVFHPESASGAKALTQMRAEGMKDAILKIKVRQIIESCYAPTASTTAH